MAFQSATAPDGMLEIETPRDLSAFVSLDAETQAHVLHLMVEGAHCGGCVRRIERALRATGQLEQARLNLTTRRLSLRWFGEAGLAGRFADLVDDLGYRTVPFDPDQLGVSDRRDERSLLMCLAIAGFGAANVMLLAVAVWAGHFDAMDATTRSLLHWFEALIALPTMLFAGRPFYSSALQALRKGHTNMDVPISLAVVLASAMSLFETIRGGEHVYFDSAVTLLFFLLIGRFLDRRARGSARAAAERLMALGATAVTLLLPDGRTRSVRPQMLERGQKVLVATGERIGIDGTIVAGISELDTSAITGETVPRRVDLGEQVFAGTINLGPPLEVAVKAAGEGTLLAEIVRLVELAEQRRGRFVAIADRIARLYAPVVHTLAAATFIGWWLIGGIGWQTSLLYGVAVLIITCPCALGLAVPAVQVIASGRLMNRGILLKSATALERFADVDHVLFDKTGTLTDGELNLIDTGYDPEDLRAAASLALNSRHPLARALVRHAPNAKALKTVEEIAGSGLRFQSNEGEWRLGRADWALGTASDDSDGPELWFVRPDHPPVRFAFHDQLRPEAVETIKALKNHGLAIELLSGDRQSAVKRLAEDVGITDWQAACKPADKAAHLEQLRVQGRKVMMVGDGLNDGPALAAAHVSLSPSTAVDLSQTMADAVFQGRSLHPVLDVIRTSRRAQRLVQQNLALSFGYNVLTIPLAVGGYVTPLVAAICMSASSILVVLNALRLSWTDRPST